MSSVMIEWRTDCEIILCMCTCLFVNKKDEEKATNDLANCRM